MIYSTLEEALGAMTNETAQDVVDLLPIQQEQYLFHREVMLLYLIKMLS